MGDKKPKAETPTPDPAPPAEKPKAPPAEKPKAETPTSEEAPKKGASKEREPGELVEAVSVLPVHQHSEFPRDSAGRVIGAWHVTDLGPRAKADKRLRAKELTGDLVDRAVSLGCALAPGPRRGR